MFWDNVAGIYDLYQIINRKANNHAASICAEYITSEDNVLECACGTGIMTRIIAPKCKMMTATDFSEKMIHKAQRKLKKYKNVSFQMADITNLEFKESTFDKVVAANVIHLLDEPGKALDELFRVVRPGGVVLIPTYISQQADSSATITKIFNRMGANFKKEFDNITYKQFFEEMGIEADYRLAPGVISCCVAIIKVKENSNCQ